MRRSLCFAVVSLTLYSSIASGAALYTLTDVGTLGGNSSYAYGINSHGDVAGRSYEYTNLRPFIWQQGHMTGIPTTGYAYAVNDNGLVCGGAPSPTEGQHAFTWRTGLGVRDIGTLSGYTYSVARAANSQDKVVGYSYNVDGSSRAFVWDSTSGMRDLGSFGGSKTRAYGVNSDNEVVGFSRNSAGKQHAFLWSLISGMEDLGMLPGGSQSTGYDINDSGQVVGWSEAADGQDHAFLWSQSQGMTDLGAYATAHAINNLGRVVGTHGNRAYVWDKGQALDLNSLTVAISGWVLQSAQDINDAGQIVGYGTYDGVVRGFILTPVPEPSSVIAILCGIGGLGGIMRRRGI